MASYSTRHCGCTQESVMGQKRPKLCEHGNLFEKEEADGSTTARHVQARGRRRYTLKQGRGFAASPPQQKKVKGLPCAVCGMDGFEVPIYAAHVYPRRLASCECADGVVPLCGTCHGRYDDPNQHLDLLPVLVNRGYRAELVHAVVAHDVPIRELLNEVTGVKWEPVREVAA